MGILFQLPPQSYARIWCLLIADDKVTQDYTFILKSDSSESNQAAPLK